MERDFFREPRSSRDASFPPAWRRLQLVKHEAAHFVVEQLHVHVDHRVHFRVFQRNACTEVCGFSTTPVFGATSHNSTGHVQMFEDSATGVLGATTIGYSLTIDEDFPHFRDSVLRRNGSFSEGCESKEDLK